MKRQRPRYPGLLRNGKVDRMYYLIFRKPEESGDLNEIESYKELYQIIYDCAVETQHGFTKPETRIYGRVLSKLESIGVVSDRTTKVKSFDLGKDGGVVALENAEFDLLQTAINAVVWQARYTRKADSLYSWLSLKNFL
jgi:hypothetical protein